MVLYSELDDARWEVRKVEVLRDRRCGHAGEGGSSVGTMLGEAAMPELTELADDPEFGPVELTKVEFERIWARREGGR